MRVFISHSFLDEEIATILQRILKDADIPAYMAQKVKEYEVLVSNKIRQEVENSDYVVSIITKHTRESASVNQELGYAQGKSVPIIAMIEEDAKIGALIDGMEYQEFNRVNFNEKCNYVKNYILERGDRKRETNLDTSKILEVVNTVNQRIDSIISNQLTSTQIQNADLIFQEDQWYKDILKRLENVQLPTKDVLLKAIKKNYAELKMHRDQINEIQKKIALKPSMVEHLTLKNNQAILENKLKELMTRMAGFWTEYS